MNWSIETVLTVHIAGMTVTLLFAAVFLWRHGLFHWTSAGFWAWASFVLYYVLNPFFALHTEGLALYYQRLAIAGGTERGLWILFVALVGIAVFFWAYLRTRPVQVNWRLSDDTFSLPMLLTALLFMAYGIYSLLTQRALVVNTGRETVIDNGRFTGQVTGYENAGYMFLMVPILLLMLSTSRLSKVLGWISAGLFIFLALPSGWARFVLVSMLLAISLADTIRRKVTKPRWLFIPILLIFTVALQLRGHTEWTLANVGDELISMSQQSLQNTASAIGGSDTSMLATWYLESYGYEHYFGYSYGLPLINYALTGWIPSNLFPQKYFLVDMLRDQQLYIGQTVEGLLYGAKSSLLGSFYSEGGLIGVILLAAVAGFLSRKLDSMVTLNAPLLVRATGVVWMSVLWMIWGSADTWSLQSLGILGLPALALWIFAPKQPRNLVKQSLSIGGLLPDRKYNALR
jgi:hypothetical protein